MSDSTMERFWAKVQKGDNCWEWQGHLRAGYGRFRAQDGRYRTAHRVACEWATGPIPGGMEVDHLCRNRACVRPDHLEAVTKTVNIRRAKAVEVQQRQTCGNGHPWTPETTRYHTLAGGRLMRSCLPCATARTRAARARKRLTDATGPTP